MNCEAPSLGLSVVAPAHDERDNVGPLVEQIERALADQSLEFEIVVVDDGSGDDTRAVLRELQGRHPRLRVVAMRHARPGAGLGQSAAFHAGFRAARGRWIVSIDADLQNDPADIPAMLELQRETGADVVQGDRSAARRDSAWRRFSSRVGRVFRRVLLGDTVRDTGCSLRLMRAELARALPLEFRGMHRFVPATAGQLGYRVVQMPVRHRARTAGRTKYGTWDRALVGLYDCFAMRWMARRRRPVEWELVAAADASRPEKRTEASA